MGKVRKVVKKSGKKVPNKYISYASDHDFILIVGGGFVVLILVMLFVLH